MRNAWQVVPPWQIVPVWTGSFVATAVLKPGVLLVAQPRPLVVTAPTIRQPWVPSVSASLLGSFLSASSQAIPTRPSSPTPIHGQITVWSFVLTRTAVAQVRPPSFDRE